MAAVTGIAFAILVSVAASHLHVGAGDSDENCAVCLAFAGKLEGPAAELPPAPIQPVEHPAPSPVEPAAPRARFFVLLPPICGPPFLA